MKIIFAALVVICGCNVIASPIDDLASPSQEARDAAAKILHSTYTPSSKTNWDDLLAQIKVGDTMTNVSKLISKYNPSGDDCLSAGSGVTGFTQYRLDDTWIITCDFEYDYVTNHGKAKLMDCKLTGRPRTVRVSPPPKFTGNWVIYFVNGQKSQEINYKDGKAVIWILYSDDGKTNSVQDFSKT